MTELLSGCNDQPTPSPQEGPGGIAEGQTGPSGSYRHPVPIEVPSYYDIAPRLQLEYDSNGGDGWLGVGWRLAGISTVRRMAPGKGVPTYSSNDAFFLDGNQLLPCKPGWKSPSCMYPASGGYAAYAPKLEDYRRVAYDSAAAPGGKWYVWDKDGTRRILEPRKFNTASPYAWDLSVVEDTDGHQVRYSYTYDAPASGVGEAYLSEISYDGAAVKFFYEDRLDPVTYANGHDLVAARRRLRAIDVQMDGVRVRTYQLAYTYHSTTGRSSLREVRQYGRDAKLNGSGVVTNAASIRSLPPTTFEPEGSSSDPWGMTDVSKDDWGLPQEGGSPLTVLNGLAFNVEKPHLRLYPSNLGDVDGNGRTDWIQAAPGLVFDPTARHPSVRVTAALAGRGAPVYTQETLSWPFGDALVYTTFMGDVDADGRSDLVFLVTKDKIPGDTHGGYFLGLAVARSVGDGHFGWLASNVVGTSWETRQLSTNRRSHCQVGDVNGDGSIDVVCSFTRGDGTHHIGTAVSQGDGGFRTYEEPAPFAAQGETRPIAIGDSNGDGLSDPMFLDHPGSCPPENPGCVISFELVTALASGGDPYEFERQPTTWRWAIPTTFFAADIDGDGRSDYVLFKSVAGEAEEGAIQTAIRRPDGSFILGEQPVPVALREILHSVSVGDTNGDGKTDLMVISRQEPGRPGCSPSLGATHVNLHRVLSRGNGFFDLPQSWEHCGASRELDLRWDSVGYTPVEPQAADLDGDNTADFLIAVAPKGQDTTTLREDLSHHPTGDTYNWRPAERNGDGRKDWVYIRNTPTGPLISSMIATGTGYSLHAQSPVPGTAHFTVQGGWRVLDVNGDGRDDLVYLDYLTPDKGIQVGVWFSQANGEWLHVPSVVFAGLSERHRNTLSWQAADVNADGKGDLVYVDQDDQQGSLAVWSLISKGDGSWVEKSDQPLPSWTPADWRNWRTADANGDGSSDLLHIAVTPDEIQVQTLFSQADGTWRPASPTPKAWPRASDDGLDLTDQLSWRVADVNGDGVSDLFHVTPTDRKPTEPYSLRILTLLAHGDGGATRPADQAPAGTVSGDLLHWRQAEVNNDNRADLVHVHVAPPAVVATTLSYSHNGGWFLGSPDINVSAVSQTSVGVYFHVADADGNGQDDLTRFDLLSKGMRLLSLRSHFNRDVMRRATLSTGGTVDIEYAPASQSSVGSASECHVPVGVRLLNVAAIAVSPGTGFRAGKETYQYDCPVWSYEHRTFLGWREVLAQRASTSTQPGRTLRQRYSLTDQCLAQPAYSDIYDGKGRVFRKTITAYLPAGSTPPYRCLVNYSNIVTLGESGQGLNVYTYYGYDDFGNVTNVFDYGANLDDNKDEQTTTIVYKPAPAPYIVGLPHQVVVSADVHPAGKGYRYVYYCYDGDNGTDQSSCAGTITKGRLTARKVVNPNGWYDTTTYQYDAHGNLETITDADKRTTTTTYDPQHHRFPEKVCGPLQQCTSYVWDRGSGRVTAVTESNQVRTDLVYDEFWRLLHVTPQGRATRHYDYLDWGEPSKQRLRLRTEDGTPDDLWSEQYLDGLGRQYREVREGAGVDSSSIRETVYADATANVARQSHWYAAGNDPVYETFTYDAVGRLLSQRHPDDSHAAWAYDNDTTRAWQRLVDEFEHPSSTYFDAYSQVVGSREEINGGNADTSFVHNAVGELETITDPGNNTTTLTWDIRGDNRGIIDSDRGSWTYDEYDRTGHVRRQIDPKNEWTRFTYDKLGRIQSKTYPSYREVKWYYDEPGHGQSAGRLTSVTDTLEFGCQLKVGFGGYITKELFYDTYGRLNRTRQCIEGKTVEMNFSYDGLDRVRTITYPDGETITYDYDSAGRIKSVSGYVEEFVYNAAGQMTTARLSNGVTETYHYDAKREWLDHITAKKGPSVFFDVGYTYYPNGLIKSTTSSTNKMNLSYVYDRANQLTDVTGDVEQHLQYDTSGNITYNSELGTYLYTPSTGTGGCGSGTTAISCPHAVKRAGTTDLTYDSAGNMTSITTATGAATKTRTIQWNKDNEPSSFKDEGGIETKVRYGDSGERVYRSRAGQTSLFFDPYVDLDAQSGSGTVKPTQYYFAGDVLLAKKDATGKRWFHRDHLGSTRLTTDQNALTVAKYDYKPFGGPIGGGGGALDGDRRFAGHRMDPDNDLIYMRARYYSGSLGRFVSPDPIIPDTYPSRATNRYAYVYNNPLSMVDPLGMGPADIGIGTTLSYANYPAWSFGWGSIHNPIPSSAPTATSTLHPVGELVAQSPIRLQRESNDLSTSTLANPGTRVDFSETEIIGDPTPLGRLRTAQAARQDAKERKDWEAARYYLDEMLLIQHEHILSGNKFTTIALGVVSAAMLGPIAGGQIYSMAASGLVAEAEIATLYHALRQNTMRHIFGKAAHGLGTLVRRLGGEEAVMRAIIRQLHQVAARLPRAGLYETTIKVAGTQVTVRGAVVQGIIRVSTAFVVP